MSRSELAALWQRRGLVRGLVVRNFKVKYQSSAVGFLWTLLNPLLTVAVLSVVFSLVVRIPLERYWAFLVSGYFVWHFLVQSLGNATYVVLEHGPLARSVPFPAEVLVLSSAISRLVELAAELGLVLLALACFHHGGIPASFAALPLLVAILFALVLALAFPLAAFSVFYRDLEHALPIALTTLFYLSPVFYPLELVPDTLRPLFWLNPIAGVLQLFQQALYYGVVPSTLALLGWSAASLALLVCGHAVFQRYKSLFAEIV